MKIDLSNAILIVDEGHNICQAAEEIQSFRLEARLLEACDRELGVLQAHAS
jgi:Rad3-related DNA helicase